MSRQRLSKCEKAALTTKPWTGHSGKLKRQQVVRKPTLPAVVTPQQDSTPTVTTRHGRKVKTAARFIVANYDAPEGPSLKGREVVRMMLQKDDKRNSREIETPRLNSACE